jgi:hypothetical protein
VTDVAEHHPEHRDIDDPGNQGRIHIGVRHRRIGLHEQFEGLAATLLPQQRRRLDARRLRERHDGAADRGQLGG